MRNNEFRKVLEECLERVRAGESADAVLRLHPQLAAELGPFVRAASTLGRVDPPKPSAEAIARARSKLLARVEAGREGKESVMSGIFKFANVAVMAVGALFVASMGIVAAAGGGLIATPFNHDGGVEFDARVVSSTDTIFYVRRAAGDYVFVRSDSDTRFEDANDNEIDRSQIQRGDDIFVRATHDSGRFYDAQLVRWGDVGPEPTPEPEPTHEPTPEPTEMPEPTHEPTPKPEPTAAPTPKPEPTHEPTPKPTLEAVAFDGIVKRIEGGTYIVFAGHEKVVNTNDQTTFPNGMPEVGDGVLVKAYVTGERTYLALTIKVIVEPTPKPTPETVAFDGIVKRIEGGTYIVFAGHEKVVNTNGQTTFPNGKPEVGDGVLVKAYVTGERTYLALTIKVVFEPTPKPTPAPEVFYGFIRAHFPDAMTICVKVDGFAGEGAGLCAGMGPGVKQVCYEFAGDNVLPSPEALQFEKKVKVTIHREKGVQGDLVYAERVEVLN